MPNPVVIVVTDGVLTLADTEAGLTTGVAYSCQVTAAAITASPNLQTVPPTFCSPQSQVPAATGYTLDLGWLQDWTAPGGGLSGYAFTHDTQEKWFSLKFDTTDTEPLAKGLVRVVAGAFGGDGGVPLTATASWPVQGKPTITTPAGTPLGAETGAEVPTSDQLDVRDEPAEAPA